MPVAPAIGFLGSVGPSPTEIVQLARDAERAGWEGVWMIEYEYDSFAFDQAIALGTSRVVTGSCIARAYTRHPLLVAETAALIDQLAPGRFVIGLGNGGVSEPPKDRAAAPATRAAKEVDTLALQRWGTSSARPVARMREYVDVIQRALAGESFDYAGDFYEFQSFKPSIVPTRHVPIYLGARREQMLRLAGEAADGVFLFLVGRRALASTIDVVHGAARVSGRSPESVKIGNLIPACVSEDGALARSAMRTYLVDFYMGRAAYADVLPAAGFPELGDELRDHLARGDSGRAAACVSDEALDELALAGTPDHCRSLLADWVERGLEVPVLYVFPSDGDWGGAYRSAITSLAPV